MKLFKGLSVLLFLLYVTTANGQPTEIYFEDFQDPDNPTGGWFAVDLTEQSGVHWHHTTLSDDRGNSTNQHPFIGAVECSTDKPTYVTPPGYGHNWDQWLVKSFVLGDPPVKLKYELQYDTEPDYDFILVEVSNDEGDTWSKIEVFDGWSGGWERFDADISEYANQEVVVRFSVTSDGAWDDEDGRYPTDGAARISSVKVGDHPTDKFKNGLDGWQPMAAPPVGGGPFRTETGLAGFGDGENVAWAAYNLYGSDADLFPFTPPEEEERGRFINIGIVSPSIAIPAELTSVILKMKVWENLPVQNLVFWHWSISSDGGPWRNDGFLYFWSQDGWRDREFDISGLVEPGAETIRIRLGALEATFYKDIFPGETHTASPFFDDVRIWVE